MSNLIPPSSQSVPGDIPSEKNYDGLLVLIAGALTLAGAMGFGRYGFPLLLPSMRESLGATYGHMGLVATINNIGYVITMIFGGMISARFGARRTVIIAMFIAGIATVATGLSPSLEFVLGMQFLVGVAAGCAVVPTMGLVAGWFEPRKRGLATGVVVGGFPLGILASSILLSSILTGLGLEAWRYGWMALGALVILIGMVDLLLMRDQRPGPEAEGGIAVRAAPLAWALVYKNRTVWLMCVINLANGFAFGIFTTFFVAFLVDQRGLPASEASAAWGLVGLLGIASGLLWGSISDRVGRKFGLAACYYTFFAALVVLNFASLPGSQYASGILGGLSVGGGLAVTVALLGDLVGPRLATAAFGLVSFFFNIGQMVSPSVGGTIIDATGSFSSSLIAGLAFAFLSATLCLLLRLPKMEDAL